MRCGCLECGAFMIHSEEKDICVCPDCGWRCKACLGTNTVVSREQLKDLKFVQWIAREIEKAQDALDRGNPIEDEEADDGWQ